MRAFAAWWYAASMVILLTVVRTALAMAGFVDPRLHTAIAQLGNLPLAAAVGCLMYYILFLLTGRHLHWAVGVVYGGYLGYLTWFTAVAGERGLRVGDWQAELVGGRAPSATANLVFGLVLALPVLMTVLAYLVLAFQVREPTQRYRLRVLSAAFLLLFGAIALAYVLRWNERPWFPLTYELPALLTALLLVLAYRPPLWVRERYGVDPLPKQAT